MEEPVTKPKKTKVAKPAVTKKTESVKTPDIIEPLTIPPVVPKARITLTSKKDVIVPVLVGAIIVASFIVGYLYGKVSVYEKVGTTPTTAAAKAGTDTNPNQPAAAPTVTADMIKKLITDKNNIVFGNPNSKLVFAEFSDPSCPYCHIAAGKNPDLNAQAGDRFKMKEAGGTYVAPVPEMKKLVDTGKAAYVWLYSPGHGNGELGTQALYCAKEQGKFWEAHDLLMSGTGYTLLNDKVQNDVKKSGDVADFLKSVLDASSLKTCLDSGKYASRVKSDEALSRTYGVQGTPSFFVNAKNFGGAYSFVDMEADVKAAL